MKIVCGACRAKYSIADEKITGRSVKIRCKKCGESIVVRGDAAPAVEAGAWHVVVDGTQRGPMEPAEIGALIADGTVGWDAYVWREGFDGWKPAEDVQELVSAIMGDAAPSPSAGADLFATEGQSAFAATPQHEDEVIASSSAHAPRADAMTGARNESSVLFSLANLSALGASAPATATKSASTAPRAMASGDGSGLIDIRALASATGLGSASTSAPKPAAKVDDLLGLGAPSIALGSALAPPVLIAAKPESSRGGSAIIVAAAILAVGLLGGASALAYVTVGQREAAPPAPIAVQTTPPTVAAPEAPTPEAPTPVVVAQLETPTPVVTPPPRVPTTRPPTHRTPTASLTETTPTPTERTAPRADPSHERTLEEMLQAAGGDPTREPRIEHAITPSLPTTPARADVMSAMTRVRDTVVACGGGEHGTATVQVTFASSGRVSNAVVSGPFAGTPVGSCIARAVRTASVPAFSQSTFSLSFPYRL